MSDEQVTTGTEVSGAAQVAGSEPPATAPETVSPAVTPNAELETLRRKVDELERRQSSPDAIADQVIQHPRLKQSLRDMTAFQVKQQMESEIDARTAAIDQMEEAGEIDPAVAEKRRRAIAKQVKTEFSGRAAALSVPEPATAPRGPAMGAQERAGEFLTSLGLGWEDVKAELVAHPQGLTEQEFRQLARGKAKAKYDAEHRAELLNEAVKVVEERAEAARRAAANGGAAPVPGGAPAKQDLTGKDSTTLYEEAFHEMVGGRR